MYNPYSTKATRLGGDKRSPGLITAHFAGSKGDHGELLTFGYQRDGLNRKSQPVDAASARMIAERNPGGATIEWQDDKCELAHVYGRA